MTTTIFILIVAAAILTAVYDSNISVAETSKPPRQPRVNRVTQIEFQLNACRRVLARFNTIKADKTERSRLFVQMNKLRAEKARLIKAA